MAPLTKPMEGLDPQRLWPANNKYHQLPSKTHASPRQTEGKTKGLCRVCVGFPWGFGRPHNVPIRSLQEDTISHCKKRCWSFCYFLRPSKIPSRNQWQRGPRTCFLSYAFFTKQNQTKCTASWLNLPGQRHTIPEHTRTKHGLVHSVATMMREMCWDIDPDNPCTFITPCEPLVTFNQIQNDETKEDFVLSRG